jgi:hypothetical protein
MKKLIAYVGLWAALTLMLAMGCVGSTPPENPPTTNPLPGQQANSFQECVDAGHPVMESYPRQCSDGTNTFTETLEMTGEFCTSYGGNWNECSNKCMLDNQGKQGVACTMQCEALCECGGIAGFNCPPGYSCKLPDAIIADALGYCIPTSETQTLTQQQALQIASTSDCVKQGTLTENVFHNDYTNTWWIDLEPFQEKQGCNPACVVNEATGTAEINWRCTGLLPP